MTSPSGAGQDELSHLGRKASLDASHPQTDEESPPIQGGILQRTSRNKCPGIALFFLGNGLY